MSEGQEHQPTPRIIQFKGEQGKIQQVNLNSLDNVFKNIDAHNKEFSLGAILAKGIMSHVKNQEDSENHNPLNPFSAEKDKGDALNETLEILHADSLSPIGISFTSSGEGATIMTGDAEIAETQIELAIQNPDLFLSFLDGISQSGKGLGEGKTSAMLNKIGLDTALQIWRNNRDINNPKNERLDFVIGRLGKVVPKFKELGIKTKWDDQDINLEDYVKYASKGILKEYIVSDFNGLLKEPKKNQNDTYFQYGSLANWSNDIGVKTAQNRWERAIFILEQMKANPKAEGLIADIKANLSHCVEEALKDIGSKDEGWDKEHSWAQRKDKKEVFENAKINLQII